MEEHEISGVVKKKGTKMGFWHKRYFRIRGNSLVLQKKEVDKDSKTVPLSSDTRVDFVPGTNNNQIIIQPKNEKAVILSPKKNERYKMLNTFRQITLCSTDLTMQSFQIITVLGRGYYGKVMLCQRINSEDLFAIKSVKKSKLIEDHSVYTIFSEKNALMRTKHPFIVDFYFAFQSESKLYLGLEYIQGGELNKYLKRVGRIEISQVRLYLAEIALAIDYLHSVGVIYRDLKPENIMLASDGHIKLTDFGLSKVSYPGDLGSTFCGTYEYIPPEMINHMNYNEAVDWWSFGILAYELSTGLTPFKKSSEIKTFNAIAKEDFNFMFDLPDDFKDLIIGLLNKDPSKRMTFKEIKVHPFFKNIDWNDVYNKEYTPSYIPFNNNDKEPVDCPADSYSTPVPSEHELFEGFSYVADSDSI